MLEENNEDESPLDGEEAVAQVAALKRLFNQPRPSVPEESLARLLRIAYQDTGGSQAARYFLFWLVGEIDPTGFRGEGALELRRLDHLNSEAALEVMTWWIRGPQSDQPLYDVLAKLNRYFAPSAGDESQ